MRDRAELDGESGRAKVVERGSTALLTCEQNSGFELRDRELAGGLPEWNQTDACVDQIGSVALQEGG